MPSCSICIDELKAPVALPCGHIFCSECLFRAVTTIKPPTSLHFCPTCRTSYSIVNVEPSMIPPHLRPHILPSVRRIYLDEPSAQSTSGPSTSSPTAATTECRRLAAENTSLQTDCGLWRKRAELHAAATLGLLNMTRMAKHQNARLAQERDELKRECNLLKRKLEAEESFSRSRSAPTSTSAEWTGIPPLKAASEPNMSLVGMHLSSEEEALLAAACAPFTRQRSGSSTSSSRSIKEPQERNLPPSLKRRKVSAPPSSSPEWLPS